MFKNPPPSKRRDAVLDDRARIQDRIEYLTGEIDHCYTTGQIKAAERLRENRRLAYRDLRDVDDLLAGLPKRDVTGVAPLRRLGPQATHPYVDPETEQIFSWGVTVPEWKRPKRQVMFEEDRLPAEKRLLSQVVAEEKKPLRAAYRPRGQVSTNAAHRRGAAESVVRMRQQAQLRADVDIQRGLNREVVDDEEGWWTQEE